MADFTSEERIEDLDHNLLCSLNQLSSGMDAHLKLISDKALDDLSIWLDEKRAFMGKLIEQAKEERHRRANENN